MLQLITLTKSFDYFTNHKKKKKRIFKTLFKGSLNHK